MTYRSVTHVAIRVMGLREAEHYYRGLFGLEVAFREAETTDGWRTLPGDDIKPANLLVRDGELFLIDVAFVETRPTPWRQAVDLANMMLCLALRSDPEQVYEQTLRQFTVEESPRGFAAARGLAMPSQLRTVLRSQGTICTPSSCGCCPPGPGRSEYSDGASAGSGFGPSLWL